MNKREIEALIKMIIETEAKTAIASISRLNNLEDSDLAKSAEVESYEFKDGFIFTLALNFYWRFVEGGRRAGAKMPPSDAILQWVRKYRIARTGISENSLVYLIRRSIADKGIKPRPFLNTIIENVEKQIEALLSEFLESILTTILTPNLK